MAIERILVMKKQYCMIMVLLLVGLFLFTGCSSSVTPEVTTPSIPESTTAAQTEENSEKSSEKESKEKETTTIEEIEESVSESSTEKSQEERNEKSSSSNQESNGETVTETITSSETTVAPVLLQGYLFEINGIQIGTHEEAKGVMEALGEAQAYYETPSCAFQGMDKQYTYPGYMITTYENNGQDYIYDIYFLDGSVSTPEGIHIGSTLEEMIGAYGEEYTEDFGMYIYVKERSKLQFLVEEGVVTSVDYTAITD